MGKSFSKIMVKKIYRNQLYCPYFIKRSLYNAPILYWLRVTALVCIKCYTTHTIIHNLAVTLREIRIVHSLLYIIKTSPSGYGKFLSTVTCRNRNLCSNHFNFYYLLLFYLNIPYMSSLVLNTDIF